MPLLNDADAIYHGATAVDAVYLGDEKVWPSAPQYTDRVQLAAEGQGDPYWRTGYGGGLSSLQARTDRDLSPLTDWFLAQAGKSTLYVYRAADMSLVEAFTQVGVTQRTNRWEMTTAGTHMMNTINAVGAVPIVISFEPLS